MRILWIPHTGWHIPQRAHLFCRTLAEQHEIHVTDWVADFFTVRDYLSRRYLRNFTYRRYLDGRITVHGVPRISPALYFSALRRLNMLIFSRYVSRIIEHYKIQVVVGTFVVTPPQIGRLIFDLFDDNVSDWRRSGRSETYANEIEATEQSYLRKADVVVAASTVLADKIRISDPKCSVELIPNGVDLQRFSGVDGAMVRDQLHVSGKLVGSLANQDNPYELRKILEVAGLLAGEDITFLIAGRGAAIPAAMQFAKHEGLSNIVFWGYVPHEDAPNVISALDVGLCSYAKTPMDDSRSPMRLLEYAAAGVPTVCTDLTEVRRMGFSNIILVEDSPESLAIGIKRALQTKRIIPKEIKAYDIQRLTKEYETVLQG